MFPDFTASLEFLAALNASFGHYANQYEGDKSVNALNCRKSGLLSQMLLRHKVICLGKLREKMTAEQLHGTFFDLIKKYCEVFMSV